MNEAMMDAHPKEEATSAGYYCGVDDALGDPVKISLWRFDGVRWKLLYGAGIANCVTPFNPEDYLDLGDGGYMAMDLPNRIVGIFQRWTHRCQVIHPRQCGVCGSWCRGNWFTGYYLPCDESLHENVFANLMKGIGAGPAGPEN